MMNVCERCSLYETCNGIKHDPNECECIENFYDQFLDFDDDLIWEENSMNTVEAA